MRANPLVSIAIYGPGSSAGIAALIDGTTDICQSSRPITTSEMALATSFSVQPHQIIVALDGIAVIVNSANPIRELTVEQLSAIYTGSIVNWLEVGGNNTPVVTLARQGGSGTHLFFKERIVQMEGLPMNDASLEYGSGVMLLPTAAAGIIETTRNAGAIFYLGMECVTSDVKVIGIKRTRASPAIMPAASTVRDRTYPLVHPLLYYTNGEPAGLTRDYIHYCLSAAGQAVIAAGGYVGID